MRFLSLLLLLFSLDSFCQSNTLTLAEGEKSPLANIQDIAWLAGHWQGEAFGGKTEELWSPPLAGSMMGAFKLVKDGKVVFYELEVIREFNQSLILQLKHFNSDMTGWEEKQQTVDFPLVKITNDAAFFSGFTIKKISINEMHMFVDINDHGKSQEVQFIYYRVQ